MDVLVLGNGFDLAHKLPTTYLCFLKTTEYIVNLSHCNDLTIGKVFSALQDECHEIKESYGAYQSVYNDFLLNPQVLEEIQASCKKNMWWQFFKKKYNKDVGWIDFEKEIETVINEINTLLLSIKYPNKAVSIFKKGVDILIWFPFFIEPETFYASEKFYNGILVKDCPYFFKSDYIITNEDPKTSQIDRRRIATDLFQSLEEFSKILSLYFELFVDQPLETLKSKKLINTNKTYSEYTDVITYNYTNTFEIIYNKKVAHIHGSLGHYIVLGINSNDDDMVNGDLSFIDFKKYYQRVVKETDLEYLNILIDMKEKYKEGRKVTLSIVGHSLDVSDKDSLEELFDASNEIIVHYHNKNMISEFMQKLIAIFGKTKFDELRFERRLRFLPCSELQKPAPTYQLLFD